jgi:hypothetical protein
MSQDQVAPTGIVTYGSEDFAGWIRPLIEQSETFTDTGAYSERENVQATIAEAKPRAVIIELDPGDLSSSVAVGIAAQKGFRWTSPILVFPTTEDALIPISASISKRKWSLVGRELIDTIGLDRVLAGALTSSGLQDLSIAVLKAENEERAASQVESDGSEDEEEDEEVAA